MKRLQLLPFILVAIFSLGWVHADNLQLTYSPTANKFHLMDHVSESMNDFFLIPAYKSLWIETYGLSEQDQNYLKRYQQLRKKYQNLELFTPMVTGKESGLFAPHPDEITDVFADAFYTSKTLEEAFRKVALWIKREELQFVRDFFEHFSEKIDKMHEFSPSSLEKILAYFNHQLDSQLATKHLADIAKFYRSDERGFKSVQVFLASRNSGSFNGRCYGDHLQVVIPFNGLPIENEMLMKYLTGVIIHEAAHHISSAAATEQKQKLTDHFMHKVGSIEDGHFLNAIEEPLVMASQMLFMKNVYPDVYKEKASWFNHPLACKYMSILDAYINEGKSIDIEFIESCANLYIESYLSKKE